MILQGDVSAVYDSGRLVLTSTQIPPPYYPGEKTMPSILAEAVVSEGRFRLVMEVEKPRNLVYFYVLEGKKDGEEVDVIHFCERFVMEPGHLKLRLFGGCEYEITGGRMNEATFTDWKQSPKYVRARKQYLKLWESPNDQTERLLDSRLLKLARANSRLSKLKLNALRNIALEHPDTDVRKLVIHLRWLYEDPWRIKALNRLAKLSPDDDWVRKSIEIHTSRTAYTKESAAARKAISDGGRIVDFEAETLTGESVRLSDVMASSEVFLLEFWASWCAPCVEKFPDMKETYEEFRSEGFEIVSFTIDFRLQEWQEASQENQLPWHDWGMGTESEAAKIYGVTGVPRNYLVDSANGKILAERISGDRLRDILSKTFKTKRKN